MLGTNILLPFLVAMVGALFGLHINEQDGLFWGAVIGFGVGCAILFLIWLLFAVLRRMVE